MKDGAVFISLQPSSLLAESGGSLLCLWPALPPGLARRELSTKKSLREKIMAFQSPTKALSMAQARD